MANASTRSSCPCGTSSPGPLLFCPFCGKRLFRLQARDGLLALVSETSTRSVALFACIRGSSPETGEFLRVEGLADEGIGARDGHQQLRLAGGAIADLSLGTLLVAASPGDSGRREWVSVT